MGRRHLFVLLIRVSLPLPVMHAQESVPDLHEVGAHQYFMERYRDFERDHPFVRAGEGYLIRPRATLHKIAGLKREVFGYLPYWFSNRQNQLDYTLLSSIAYFSGEAAGDGTIGSTHGWPRYPGDPGASVDVVTMINTAHAHGIRVVLCITNFDGNAINAIVSTPAYTATFIQQTLSIVMAGNGDGVNINFEGVLNSSRANLTSFMKALADTFHTRLPGSQVSCAPTDFDLRSGGGDWDLAAIDPFIDLFFVQGYGYGYGGSTTTAPVGLLPNTAFWGSVNITTLIDNVVLARIGPGKVVLGVPHYGYRWPTVSANPKAATQGSGVAFYYPDALGYIASYGRQWDSLAQNPWYRYQAGAQWYQGWYDDPESMSHKYQFVLDRNLKGIGMWSLGMDPPNHDIWDVLGSFFSDSSVILPAPKAPALALVKDTSVANENKILVRWSANTESYLGGYRLYRSRNATIFSGPPVLNEGSLNRNSTVALLDGPGVDTTWYFRLVAVDTSHTRVSDSSDTYGARSGEGNRYLIVDGFDRTTGSYNLPRHAFVGFYGDPLAAAGRFFHSTDNDAVRDGIVRLSDYSGVIWFLGDESVANKSLDALEQSILRTYLDQGGRLFITGSEIGYDIGRAASPNYSPSFYADYLKAVYAGDQASGSVFSGVSGSIFQGVSGQFGQTYVEDYPDYISPTGGSTAALMYNGAQTAAIQYSGPFGAGGGSPGKLMYAGFGFETIASDVTRNDLLARILIYFDGVVNVSGSGSPVPGPASVPAEFALYQNYPNPFNPVTTIVYDVPAGVEAPISVTVHDLLGREVRRLVKGITLPGRYAVSFDATGLASGVYLYRLQSGVRSMTRKLLLLR